MIYQVYHSTRLLVDKSGISNLDILSFTNFYLMSKFQYI